VDLLLFFHVSIVLGHTAKGELVHKIDFIRLVKVFVLESLAGGRCHTSRAAYHKAFDNKRECGTEEHDLPVFWKVCKKLFNDWSELWT